MSGIKKRLTVALCCLMFLVGSVYAQSSPKVLLNSLGQKMFAALAKNKSALKTSRGNSIVHGIVNRILIPYVDIPRMSASVVGRSYWLRATPAQKKSLMKQFKNLVINTYSSALSSYDDDRIRFYPIRGGVRGRSYLRVNSLIIRKNGQKIPISYNVLRSGSSWKIYDFSIENISMAQSYRSQFAGILSRGGMSALINRMKSHNLKRRR